MPESGIDADDLGIRFAVDQAWKSVKRGTAYAGTGVQGFSFRLIQQDAERQGERMMTQPLEIVE